MNRIPDTIKLLNQLEDIILDSLRIVFTSNRVVNEQEILDAVSMIREALPREFSKADEILSKSELYLQNAKIESEIIIDSARKERQRLLDKSTLIKEAQKQRLEIELKSRKNIREMNRRMKLKEQKVDQQIKEKITKYRSFIKDQKIKLRDKVQQLNLESENLSRQKQALFNLTTQKPLTSHLNNNSKSSNFRPVDHSQSKAS